MNFQRFLFSNLVTCKPVIKIRMLSCWACGNDVKTLLSNLFCSKCNALQRPKKEHNYFEILGVSETYDLKENDLARRYKDLQKHLHPDKFATRPKEEQEISEEYSSLVNEAYNTLLGPLTRGIYMLQLRGKQIPEKTEVDQEFLMKIMEKNEEVENAETDEEIMLLNKENKAAIAQLHDQLSKAFFDGNMKRVINLLSILKYYTSIDAQIQAAIRSKGIIR